MPRQELIQVDQLDQHLTTLGPQFAAVLAHSSMTPERLRQNMIWSVQRNNKLLECTMDSLVMAAQTAANLELMVDSITSQFHMLPFRAKRLNAFVAQPLIGYKGYNTLAAREHITIDGAEVREGDTFEYMLGTGGFVRHFPKLGHRLDRPIIAAWATAAGRDRPPAIMVLDIDEIEAIRARAPAGADGFSPWQDQKIGFPAMATKTAKRRLGRVLPIGAFVRASVMEEAFEERGRAAAITLGGQLQIEGEARLVDAPMPQPDPEPDQQAKLGDAPKFPIMKPAKGSWITDYSATIQQWRGKMETAVSAVLQAQKPSADKHDWLVAFRDRNAPVLDELGREYPDDVRAVADLLDRAIKEV